MTRSLSDAQVYTLRLNVLGAPLAFWGYLRMARIDLVGDDLARVSLEESPQIPSPKEDWGPGPTLEFVHTGAEWLHRPPPSRF